MPKLVRINVFPIKSLDPLPLERAVLLPSGALEHDRRYAMRDAAGEILTAKRTLAAQRLRSAFDPTTGRLTLRVEGTEESHTFDVIAQRDELSRFLSDYFSMPLELVENSTAGFPDDTDSPGPTLISTATLGEVASWFPGISTAEARRRFRANLEIDTIEPFWEDHLVVEAPRVVRFRIGEAELLGTNPCQRCPVPGRNSFTSEPTRGFAKTFAERREAALPSWAPAGRFNHFYRLAVNTRPANGRSATLEVGNEVTIVGIE
jgi:hypothetical protein